MADGLRIYAGTRDGLQVLTLNKNHTELACEAFSDEIIQAVTGCRTLPEQIFVGLRDGLYRSKDAGQNWTKVLEADVRSVTVDPSNEEVIYAGTDPVGLFRSEDGGDKWEELVSLLKLPDETHEKLGEWEPLDMALHFDPAFRHRRQNWWFQEPPYQGHVLQIFVHPEDSNLLMLSIEHGGVAYSADRGKTWSDISEGIDYLDMHFVTSAPRRFDRFLVTSARGLYSTSDPLQGWTRAQEGCDRNYFHDLTFLPSVNGEVPATIVATADGSPGHWRRGNRIPRAAIYRSYDFGESWQRVGVGNGLAEEMDFMVWAFGVHPEYPKTVVAGAGDSSSVPSRKRGIGNGSILISGDSGDSWRTLKDGIASVEQMFVGG